MALFDFFVAVVIVSMFWAFAITTIVYSLPIEQRGFVAPFSTATNTDIGAMGQSISAGTQQQKNIPQTTAGPLTYFSGIFFIDLMSNFLQAIPQMLTLLIYGLLFFFPIDVVLKTSVTMTVQIIASAIYGLAILNVIINMFSGGGTGGIK
jgi:hypothetical protein